MSGTTKTRTVEVRIGALKAALLFAPKNDVRAYLCGACIDHGPKGVRLVATDGHRLLVVNLTDTPQNLSVRYVLSRDVMERAVKAYANMVAERGARS
jgi:DNA polymerase III sliding clamp (beta) subunit (PCNA family)